MKRKTEVKEPSAFFPKIQSKHKYNNGLILPTLTTLTWNKRKISENYSMKRSKNS